MYACCRFSRGDGDRMARILKDVPGSQKSMHHDASSGAQTGGFLLDLVCIAFRASKKQG